MRVMISWFKEFINGLDGVWIDNAGWPIQAIGYIVPSTGIMTKFENPITFHGFYTLPEAQRASMFRTDDPDEMIIEVNPEEIKYKLEEYLKIGLLLRAEDRNWVINHMSHQHHWFYGKRRLNLHCNEFAESVTK